MLVVGAAPLASHAADVRPVLKAGYDTGGDTIVTAIFSGGSTRSLNANEGLYFGGGASILTDSKDIEVEVTLSYKFGGIGSRVEGIPEPNIEWTLYPIDVLVFYRLPQFRVGGGLTYHFSPTLKGSGASSGLYATYDDALGFVLQADYVLRDRFNFGLRYTSVSYKASTVQWNASLDATRPSSNPKASGFGFVVSMSF